MLRITVHEDSSTWRMQLEGKLGGAWVLEARHVWESVPAGKIIEIDLKGVTCVDDEGRMLLAEMSRDGVRFIAEGFAMKSILSEIAAGKRKLGSLVCALILALMFTIVPAHAQEAAAPIKLTLKDAVTIALKQNPQVAIANLNLAESQQNQNLARAAFLPQASFGASDKVTRGNVEALLGTRIPGFPGHTGPFWTIQAGPQFSATVFDLTLWNRWKAARETVKAANAQQTTTRELTAQLVVSQYLGSLRAAADVSAAKSRLDLAKALFDLASDLQKSGVGTGIDTLRAHVEYQNERQRYTEAGTQYKVALYGLSRLLNLDPQQPIELADEPSFFETPAFDSQENLTQAYDTRPEMRTVLSQIRSAEFEKSAAKDQRLPRLSVAGGWSLQGVTPTSMIPVYQYGASFEVPLFTGGRIQAQTSIADLELKKLAQNETEIRNQIALEVKTALAQLESAKVEVEAANLGVTLARESVSQAQDRFRAGVANNIEVITAQDELSRANDNQITALYRYNQSRADLARATGRMEALYAK